MIDRQMFIAVYEVENSNPNGDPDMSGMPRIDSETEKGLITDVCVKRHSRNYMQDIKGKELFISKGSILGNTVKDAVKKVTSDMKKKDATKKEIEDAVVKLLCAKYWDARVFGAVLTTKKEEDSGDDSEGAEDGKGKGKGINAQIHGPVQIAIGQSIDRVKFNTFCITRCAVASDKESKNQDGMNQTMGNKSVVSYGVYVVKGYIDPYKAEKTGFVQKDAEDLFESLLAGFSKSSARTHVGLRRLYTIEHLNSPLNLMNDFDIEDAFTISKKVGVDSASKFSDYDAVWDMKKIVKGIRIKELVSGKEVK